MNVYMNISEGKERLIVDGSFQLFGRLLETMINQARPPENPPLEIPIKVQPAADNGRIEVQDARTE